MVMPIEPPGSVVTSGRVLQGHGSVAEGGHDLGRLAVDDDQPLGGRGEDVVVAAAGQVGGGDAPDDPAGRGHRPAGQGRPARAVEGPHQSAGPGVDSFDDLVRRCCRARRRGPGWTGCSRRGRPARPRCSGRRWRTACWCPRRPGRRCRSRTRCPRLPRRGSSRRRATSRPSGWCRASRSGCRRCRARGCGRRCSTGRCRRCRTSSHRPGRSRCRRCRTGRPTTAWRSRCPP